MVTVKKPNHLLRYEREKRGLSQRKVADLLDTSEEMVSRWERGERKTSPFYQEKLCQLFGKDAIDLGFLDPPAFPAPDEVSQALQEEPSPIFLPSTVRTPTRALDLLLTSPGIPVEQQAGAWLTLGASSLGQLFAEGWTVESVFNTLAVILHGVQAMPAIARSQLVQPDALAMPGHIHLLASRRISAEERERLTRALGESIATAWKLFNTCSIPQSLATGQALLSLAQQVHGMVYSDVLPLFYSAIYRLIGASLFFQARYAEALHAHEQSYLTALQAVNSWHMAESLAWQSGVWKACGKFEESIRLTQAALRLIQENDDVNFQAAQIRLFALWAESAALQGETKIVEEKLNRCSDLLSSLEPNDEFDTSIWHYYQGTCAFYLGNGEKADRHFQQALQNHHPDWLLQRANTALLQAEACLKKREPSHSLKAAQIALPLVIALDSPLVSWGFLDYTQKLSTQFPNLPVVAAFAEETKQRLVLPAHRAVSRYLEAELA